MKKLLVFSLAAALMACNGDTKKTESVAVATAKNTDLIGQNLQGKVKELAEANYNMDSTGKMKPDSSVTHFYFDEKGYQDRYTSSDSSGKVTMEQTLKHNPDGSFAEYVNMKNGKMSEKLVTEMKDSIYIGGKLYDSTGKQIAYFDSLKQNEFGMVYEGKKHAMDGKVIATWTSKYEGSHYVGGSSTDSTGKTDYSGTIKLNDKGDPIEETTTTLDKGVSKTETLTYKYEGTDDKGNWLQRTTYNDKGKATKVVKRTITYY